MHGGTTLYVTLLFQSICDKSHVTYLYALRNRAKEAKKNCLLLSKCDEAIDNVRGSGNFAPLEKKHFKGEKCIDCCESLANHV